MKGTTIAILVVLVVIAYLIWKATQPKESTTASSTSSNGAQRLVEEKGEEPFKCTLVSANGRQVTITSDQDNEFFREVCRGERRYYVQGIQYWPQWLYFPNRPHFPHPIPHPHPMPPGPPVPPVVPPIVPPVVPPVMP